MDSANELFAALSRVTSLRFRARGRLWTGCGSGTVLVAIPNDSVRAFHESGTWETEEGKSFAFSNVFRWSLIDPERVRLEHLRFGPDHPVVLFDLVPAAGGWRTDEAHHCRADCYTAELQLLATELRVSWHVSGPKKDETIQYTYSW